MFIFRKPEKKKENTPTCVKIFTKTKEQKVKMLEWLAEKEYKAKGWEKKAAIQKIIPIYKPEIESDETYKDNGEIYLIEDRQMESIKNFLESVITYI